MQEKARIYISVCSHARPWWPMVMDLHTATVHASQAGLTCKIATRVGESLISRARNDELATFMETDFDYFMTLDDDIGMPIETITRFYEHQVDVICGFYRIKKSPGILAQRLKNNMPFDYYAKLFEERKLVEIVYGSTGCMMLKRDVIVKMQNHYTDLKYKQNMTGRTQWALYQPFIYEEEYLSEDWAFCQRAIALGYVVYGDGGVRCDHYGTQCYKLGKEVVFKAPPEDNPEEMMRHEPDEAKLGL